MDIICHLSMLSDLSGFVLDDLHLHNLFIRLRYSEVTFEAPSSSVLNVLPTSAISYNPCAARTLYDVCTIIHPCVARML